jgi:hypothetical protein
VRRCAVLTERVVAPRVVHLTQCHDERVDRVGVHSCALVAATVSASMLQSTDAEVGFSSRLESRPRLRFSRKETGFECWQPRTAAIVQHHQYGQSEQRHRHLRSGRGSIYLVEGALDAQRRRQHEQVLVQRLPPCSFETTLPPHPGRTGKWSAGFLQRFQSCTTELLSQLTSISHRHYAKGFICLRLTSPTRHLVDFFGCFDFCFFSAGQGSARGAPRDDAVAVVQTVSRPHHAVARK